MGNSATSQNLLKLNFDYGTTDNNGNLKSQTITVPTVGANQGFTAVQNYSYDSLNRIKSAVENIGATQTWKQTFQYDRFGNRRFDEANTTTLTANCPTTVCNPTIDPTTNKLIGYTFDNAGNAKVDANGQTFIYDGENKQIRVKDANNNLIGEYFYDGDGKRVKKVVPTTGETTLFVYDASNKLVAEYSTVTNTNPQISYLTNDHLGSPRITTDGNGQVVSRRDFLPFGEEIARANYGSDSVMQKFSGYERDAETDLDFAQARMYNKNHGRFTSVDPLMASADIINPQTYNRYAYTMNRPLILTDPSGLDASGGSGIKHPDKRLGIVITDGIITVSITTDLSPIPDPVTGISGQQTRKNLLDDTEDKYFVFEIKTRLTGEDGSEVSQSDYTTQTSTYNDDGTINSNTRFDADGQHTVTENSTEVNENPIATVRQDGSQEPSEDKNRVKINVSGVETFIDYTVKREGNNVIVVQDYDNKIIVPNIPKFIYVPINKKPDPIVESMRPKRNGLELIGY